MDEAMSGGSVLRAPLFRAVRAARRFTGSTRPRPGPVPAVPDGWSVGLPDFIGIGAPTASTGWWLAQIERHPRVGRAPGSAASTRWFDRFWVDDPGGDLALGCGNLAAADREHEGIEQPEQRDHPWK